jgi:hypothetical protein
VPQITVDPDNRGELTDASPFTPIPPRAREFGFVPNLRECLPGDLILFRDITPGFFGRSISNAQRQFSEEDAQWTHAAVYLYDDLVVEAVPFRGVRTRSLYTDIPNRIWRVRRQPDLSESLRYKIALRALSMLGSRYSLSAALAIGWRTQTGIWDRIGTPSFGPVIICSKVFHDAYVEITRSLLQGCSIDQAVTPAHLSATIDLQDVPVRWIKLIAT